MLIYTIRSPSLILRRVDGNELPKTIGEFGETPEQIFATYATLEEKYGKSKMDTMPLRAVAMYTYVDKLRTGLSQLMAGARSFRLDTCNSFPTSV